MNPNDSSGTGQIVSLDDNTSVDAECLWNLVFLIWGLENTNFLYLKHPAERPLFFCFFIGLYVLYVFVSFVLFISLQK